MNRASIIALVIGALLFGCGAGMVAHEVLESEADAQVAWTGQQWEYTTLIQDYPLEFLHDCKALGAHGWEAAAAVNNTVIFKRPMVTSAVTIKPVEKQFEYEDE